MNNTLCSGGLNVARRSRFFCDHRVVSRASRTSTCCRFAPLTLTSSSGRRRFCDVVVSCQCRLATYKRRTKGREIFLFYIQPQRRRLCAGFHASEMETGGVGGWTDARRIWVVCVCVCVAESGVKVHLTGWGGLSGPPPPTVSQTCEPS